MRRVFILLALATVSLGQAVQKTDRPRIREAGVTVGVLATGPLNAITDVPGVQVGHSTIIRGDDVRTGVTAVLPHAGNMFREKVPGAVVVGNGFGKLAGSTQINELGEIETPILLTSTLSVPRVADAVIDYMLALPGNEEVRSINPLVAETNDGQLNDIRGRYITRDDVISAIKGAKGGVVEEGAVGAGTGTVAFGFKGGVGTSSRRLPESLGGYTLGVLAQTNFGGVLTIAGAPVGRELGRYYLKEELERSNKTKTSGRSSVIVPGAPTKALISNSPAQPAGSGATPPSSQPNTTPAAQTGTEDSADGSCIVVIATDAPLDSRNLRRLAARAMMGLARTGSSASNGSGDYAIAFSTAASVRINLSPNQTTVRKVETLSNDAMSPLFLAVIEATEEAVYNSLFRAKTTTGRGRTVEALPIDRTLEILRKYGVIR